MPSWMIFRSVPQMPQARTLTSTSSSPGAGTGRCCSSNRCGATSTVAVIVSGIAMMPPWSRSRSAHVELARQFVHAVAQGVEVGDLTAGRHPVHHLGQELREAARGLLLGEARVPRDLLQAVPPEDLRHRV